MKIFLSWSGEDSLAAAKLFKHYLPFIVNQFEPWLSREDIQAGGNWDRDISRALSETDFGILFVTPTNGNKPWLLFEAGALAKAVDDSRVCPYLLHGMEPYDIPGGPLTRFQALKATKEATFKLVKDFNFGLGEERRSEAHIREVFEKFWPDIEKGLAGLPKTDEQPIQATDVDRDAEILQILRRLDRRSVASEPNAAEEHLQKILDLRERRQRSNPSATVYHGPSLGTGEDSFRHDLRFEGTNINVITPDGGRDYPTMGSDNH